jgi:hypothetical protein
MIIEAQNTEKELRKALEAFVVDNHELERLESIWVALVHEPI